MTDKPDTRPAVPEWREGLPERQAYEMTMLAETGLLWFINRTVFHPRGYALALDYSQDRTQVLGWSLHHAGEPVTFRPDLDEAAKLVAVEHLLADAREHRVSPSRADAQWPWPAGEEQDR